jgi:hypothetical protein
MGYIDHQYTFNPEEVRERLAREREAEVRDIRRLARHHGRWWAAEFAKAYELRQLDDTVCAKHRLRKWDQLCDQLPSVTEFLDAVEFDSRAEFQSLIMEFDREFTAAFVKGASDVRDTLPKRL